MAKYNPSDPTSFSQPNEVKVRSFHLDWTVDFDEQTIKGSVTLNIVKSSPSFNTLTLDSRDLKIGSVDVKDGEKLSFKLGEAHKKFGSPLLISLPDDQKLEHDIVITYETGKKCTALQWLNPQQTADKVAPYVFSQCQAIHCRSLLPIQDTPGVKCSYTARVRVPSSVTGLMSAVKTGETSFDGYKECRFEQTVPIPSYLVAIVAGKVEGVKVSDRVTIWCEPSVVEKAKYEFAETEQFVSACEGYCGPYIWKVYDLVILPPSFPFGGMENPCLTFVTPTLLAGDRSAVDVIIHEITHSWTGNLVTCVNWEHFWLNEGFTMFIERKVEERLHGAAARHLSCREGWNALSYTVTNSFPAGDPLTALVPKLTEVDPDDAFSSVPYEKGHSLLFYLEQLLTKGDPGKFDKFIRSHIEKFKHQCITTDDFKTNLYNFFSDQKDTLDAVDWDAWLYSPGMPPFTPKFDESLIVVCNALHSKWVSYEEASECLFTAEDMTSMSSNQVKEFLQLCYDEASPVPVFKLKKMAEVYGMWDRSNCEIKMRWLKVCLKAKWSEVVTPAFEFLSSQGRMKFTVPIYRELNRWEGEVREKALAYFAANKDSMMHVGAAAVANVLGVKL